MHLGSGRKRVLCVQQRSGAGRLVEGGSGAERSSLGRVGRGERAPDPHIPENRQPCRAGKAGRCVIIWFSFSKVALCSLFLG